MKKLLLILFILVNYSFNSFSQVNLSDSTVQVLSYWDKNETHNYKIVKHTSKFKNNIVISTDSTSYDVEITVLDSTTNSYTIQWIYKNMKYGGDKIIEKIMEKLPQESKIIFETDELGVYREVINWEEIRDLLYNSTESVTNALQTIEGADKSLIDNIVKLLLSSYSTKEAIEATVIGEIMQFHMFHGIKYKLGEPITDQVELANIFSTEPLIADASFSLEEIYSEESYSMESVQSVPREKLAAATIPYITKIAESMGQTIDTKHLENMALENSFITVSELHRSGWVLSSFQRKTVESDSSKTIKECSIELEQ